MAKTRAAIQGCCGQAKIVLPDQRREDDGDISPPKSWWR
jgi:hypothetical protein